VEEKGRCKLYGELSMLIVKGKVVWSCSSMAMVGKGTLSLLVVGMFLHWATILEDTYEDIDPMHVWWGDVGVSWDHIIINFIGWTRVGHVGMEIGLDGVPDPSMCWHCYCCYNHPWF
jgi:hypothetical protein